MVPGDTASRSRPPGTAPEPREEQIHRAVVTYLRLAARVDVAWTHMPSGEARGAGVGGKLAGLGHKPGWPDLLLVRDGRLFGLELKTRRGRPSPSQIAAHHDLRRAGAAIAVAHGLDEAITILNQWEMVR